MKSKKAQGSFDIARKTLYWVISGILLSILALALILLMIGYKGSLTKISPELESTILYQRFLNSPKCFAYQDPLTGRTNPRLIDLDRFKDQIIKECYLSDTTKDYQFKLILRNLDTKKEHTIQTAEWFNLPSITFTEPVSIKQGNQISNGLLLIITQKPI